MEKTSDAPIGAHSDATLDPNNREILGRIIDPLAFKTMRDIWATTGIDAENLPPETVMPADIDLPAAAKANDRAVALAKADLIISLHRKCRHEDIEAATTAAEGWPVNAGGGDYQFDGNQYWDAGNVYDQGRGDAAAAVRSALLKKNTSYRQEFQNITCL